jgi:hypothetical protein
MYVAINAKGNIDLVYVDAVHEEAAASTTVNDREYELWTFEQQWLVSGELTSRDILVYKDGSTYTAIGTYQASQGASQIQDGERIRFALDADEGINEEATLAVVPGYGTKHIYDPTTAEQYELFALYAEASNNPYRINLLPDDKTDSITDFVADAAFHQDLLVEALLQASSATAAAQQLYPELTLDAAIYTNGKLANGRYFVSIPANIKAEQYFAYVVVRDNKIANMFVDATRYVGGEIVTLAELGEAETPLAIGVKTEPDNDDFYELVGADIAALVKSQTFIETMADDFGYRDLDDITPVTKATGSLANVKSYQPEFIGLVNELGDVALRAYVAEYAELVADEFEATALAGGIPKVLLAQGTSSSFNKTISLSDVNESGVSEFPGSTTAKFTLRFDSADSRTLSISSFDLTAASDVTATTVVPVTMRLTFEDFDEEYTVSYTVKPLNEYNADAIAFANRDSMGDKTTKPLAEAWFSDQLGFSENTVLSGLNNLRMIVGDTNGTYKVEELPTSLGIYNSGTSLNNYLSGVSNVSWSIRYGATNESGVTKLSELPAGVYTLTMKLVYDNLGTVSDTDDKFLLQDYTVTVLSVDDALASAMGPDLSPGIIVNNGEVSATTIDLDTKPSAANAIAGLSYVWTVRTGGENAKLNAAGDTLTITRLYSQDKVELRGTATHTLLPLSAGTNFKTFEFRVLPESVTEIQSRIDKLTANVFERAPKLYDIVSVARVGDLLADLDDFLSTADLGVDEDNATIVWTIADANTPKLQNSAANLATGNLVYIDPATNHLRLGQNALMFNGDVSVTITATVEVRYNSNNVKADVTSSESFTLKLINDRIPTGSVGELILFESGVGSYAIVRISENARGASLSKVDLVLASGVSTTLASVPYGPAISGNIPGGVAAKIYPSLAPAWTTNSGFIPTLQISYSYYVDGKEIVAVNKAETILDEVQPKAVAASGTSAITTDGTLNGSGYLVLTLANGEFRSEGVINSGTFVITSGADEVVEDFTLIGLSADKKTAVIDFSGTSPLVADSSGVTFSILASAYYRTHASNQVGLTVTGLSSYQDDALAAAAVAQSGLDNRILLTLSNAEWKPVASLIGAANSGLWTFSGLATPSDANSIAIFSGILAGNVERLTDQVIAITPASGLLEVAPNSVADIAVTSGAFLQTSSISLNPTYSRVVAVSGLSVASSGLTDDVDGDNTVSSGVLITLANAKFRNIGSGFSISSITITGSGSTVVNSTTGFSPKQEADSVASVLNAALQAGNYEIDDDELLIKVFNPLVTKDNQLIITVSPSAIYEGTTDPDRTAAEVTFSRADARS